MKNSELIFTGIEGVKSSLESLETDTLIVLVDLNVYPILSKKMDLNSLGKKVILWKAPPGENVKNIQEYERCMEFLLEKGVHRKSHLLAIGGGALSDFAGFVASTLLRGISWSVISTSLLSMIDASIGGKVAINSASGKNLIGSFHLPEMVYFDFDFLQSLPVEEHQAGLGELIKYAYLEPKIAKLIEQGGDLNEIIQACAEYKKEITTQDFKEGGKRKILNLGHTFGHALEYIYPLKHGIAVFWGMAFIYILFDKEEELEKLNHYRSKLSLNLNEPPWLNKNVPIEEIMSYIKKDKKVQKQDSIEVILPQSKGVEIIEVKLDELSQRMEAKKEEVKRYVLS